MPVPGGTLTSTSTFATRVATALDLEVAKYLKEEPHFRTLVDSRPERQAHPGKVVTKTVRGELALATTPLSETADVDSVAPPADRQFTVTMNEYGNVMQKTRLLSEVEWSQAVGQEIGEEMGLNATRSIDKVVQNVLDTATNVFFVNDSGQTVVADPGTTIRGPITAKSVHRAKTLLRRRNAVPRYGSHSACIIHPDVLSDLMDQTGDGAWRTANERGSASADALFNRVAHDWTGVRFTENSNCTVVDGTGDTLYTTYFVDKEALIELNGVDIMPVVADPIDALNRFYRVGWYALLGWSIYRQNAIQLVKTTSNIDVELFTSTQPAYDGRA